MISFLNLNQVSKLDVAEVGGKAASLGELIKIGIPVPEGLVIPSTILHKDSGRLQLSEKDIVEIFKTLKTKRVAVRSSAVAEDSKTASWAGQLETYLNITKSSLSRCIYKCYRSIYSKRARVYALRKRFDPKEFKVAVVIQRMVDSDISGVAFTSNPITKDNDEVVVEAIFGLGELLVQGVVTPDNYSINKNSLEIIQKEIGFKKYMLVFKNDKNLKELVPKKRARLQVLSNDLIRKLAELVIKIEKHYKCPQDIEWTVDQTGKIWILQSRPITTL